MAIIQEAFDIPDNIAVGLASGLYRRIGGVVRYAVGPNKGQIVKHLKPIAVPVGQEDTLSLVEKAIQFGKTHKKLMAVSLVVAGTAAAGGGIKAGISAKKRAKFQDAFKRYIDAVRSGNMTVEIIEELEASLSCLKAVNMKTDELSVLVSSIREYTEKLADDNNIKFKIKENETPTIDLKQYLKMQKRILKKA